MTLPVGTALENGQYVVDAYCFADSLAPTYLVTAVQTGEQLQLKDLGHPDPEVASHYQAWIAELATCCSGYAPPQLASIYEQGRLCLILSTRLGLPLTQLCTEKKSIPIEQALNILRQVISALAALDPPNCASLDLDISQIWWQPGSQAVYLSGFGLPSPHDSTSQLGSALGRLLYFLLCGSPMTAIAAPFVYLHQRHPAIARSTEASISEALAAGDDFCPRLWLERLEQCIKAPASIPLALASERSQLTIRGRAFRPRLRWVLLVSAALAGFGGLGFGLALRFQPAGGARQVRLSPEQDFPPIDSWPGTWGEADFDQPYHLDPDPIPEASYRRQPLPATPEPDLPLRQPIFEEAEIYDPETVDLETDGTSAPPVMAPTVDSTPDAPPPLDDTPLAPVPMPAPEEMPEAPQVLQGPAPDAHETFSQGQIGAEVVNSRPERAPQVE